MPSRKWYHPQVGGKDAEKLLMECGIDGAFLVRRSKSNPNDFTLSCRQGANVTHIKIQHTDEFYDLYGGEKFATLSELVEYYRLNPGQLKEKKGGVIELKYPLLSEDVTSERWYHGGLSGKAAEKLLKEQGSDGSFLVRESKTTPGNYVLSSRSTVDHVTHVVIRNVGGRFDVGGGVLFEDLTSLIDHYRKNPMMEENGKKVRMAQPFNATRVSAISIQARMAELNKETDEVFGHAGFYEEFEKLQQMEEKNLRARTEGQRPENKTKNRYKNILPFDDTRVTLKGDPAVVGSDYINANYIDGEASGTKRAYIASQGPLKATVASFWQMIWENNVRLIVMTTAVVERKKNKCHPYWPTKEGVVHGDYVLEYIDSKESRDCILRKMKLIKAGAADKDGRVILQYHFKGWPDHGVPAEPATVLQFLEDVNEMKASLAKTSPDIGPTIIHCSAGIGRTGTFIVIDILLRAVQEHGVDVEIDITKSIQAVRHQRSGMIQTEEQYRFCYEAIACHIATLNERGKAIAASGGADAAAEIYSNMAELNRAGRAAAAPVRPPPRRV
mmetsp:Transcript_24786/g.64549  ORF Transcript_24786/g.64549 Transcript_24786/m.64549 type:complete len:557 (-) Transcript_24786:67-1737(-)|eukprot:CAMPEP_0182922378 /NCGR_PEP_ID=MMETSP0105_2-20130417/4753_1 /TAXON_ID=81532 ORGANISM="Acanthoeca-like sp., Strain 10tr" /NCGR_SAMPLE_ID=MMETSP0105_2 /ASSEMBLY_ACC=CAM_ASM_000205 /LENGTH=556 /DNA_ID=CAMNT_0025059987 /DNA_START=102 /DNA_END=1772 /DNA_ORIENTATION=+